MSDYVLMCGSTADLKKEHFDELGIEFIPFHFQMDGEVYPDDLGQSMDFKEFYERIAKGAMPTTSQINVGQYIDAFEPHLQEGKDILYVTLSSGISGSYNSGVIAKKELDEKYPDRKIYIVDSMAASSGFGLLMDSAGNLKKEGMNIDSLKNWLEENKLNLHHWFFSTDLSHYKRGGRISAASATFGTLLNICPMMNVDHEGKLIPRKKVRGKNKVIAEIVEMMKKHARDGLNYNGKCYISNSNCIEDAQKVADLIEKNFPNLDGKVLINSIGTVIGAHTGPGTVALFFYGDKRVD